MKVAIIGTGNLGLSIIKGLINNDFVKKNTVIATRRKIEKIQFLEEHGVQITSDNQEAVRKADIIILALKSYTFEKILAEIHPVLEEDRHQIISLAAGITLEEINQLLKRKISLYRAMPNIASATNESLTLVSGFKENVKPDDIVFELFNQVGMTVSINEELMDAGTILGASGIAFVMRFMRAMAQGGIEIGFDAKTAAEIVNQVTKGASELLLKSHNHPEAEIDKVTTPRGCTIKGLNAMEHNGFSSSLIQGIVASYEKLGD
ncbi:MAG: pyrroline-5-carboxylate reductase [Flavobacteriales bacterium]